jgi:hypothetical protein
MIITSVGQLEQIGFSLMNNPLPVSWCGIKVYEQFMRKENEYYLFIGAGKWQKYLLNGDWLEPA